MASSVNQAFNEFLRDSVNLAPADTALARSSRDWLVNQIDRLPERHDDFPRLYPDVHIHYGSFARRTKIRELDDLDMIIGITALGTTYWELPDRVELLVPDGIALRHLCHDGTNRLNSRRVINKFVKHLAEVPQYAKAEIKRNETAAVLNLSSYTWSFDVVPGFFTTPEYDGRTYYIIPDGSGHWMKTDPRVDEARAKSINQAHGRNVLNVIRTVKYWNARPTMPSIQPYLLECLILDYYNGRATAASEWVDLELASVLDHVSRAVLGSVQDPKGIQGDINLLSWDQRAAISTRASQDVAKCVAARKLESSGDHEASIEKWREVFGPAFPTYG